NKYSFSTSTNTWTVTDKTGTTYRFGSSTAARQDDPSNSNHIFKWMLDEIRDSNGNYISFSYYKDAGQIYPSLITYTGNGSMDGPFQMEFIRESRTDTA